MHQEGCEIYRHLFVLLDIALINPVETEDIQTGFLNINDSKDIFISKHKFVQLIDSSGVPISIASITVSVVGHNDSLNCRDNRFDFLGTNYRVILR